MARSRNIKPAFFVNEQLAETDPLARLLFISLWTLADRDGRLEYRPKKIKVSSLPYDNCDIENLLFQLNKFGFIQIYEVEKNKYIQIINFKKHQNPHMKEQASTIPAPDLHDACMIQALPLTDSLNPHTDTLILNPLDIPSVFSFEEFWKMYPDGTAKGARLQAEKSYLKAVKSGAKHDEIIFGLEKYKKYCSAGNYNKHASTWLNQKGWLEDWSTGTGVKDKNRKLNYGERMMEAAVRGVQDYEAGEMQNVEYNDLP